MITNVSVSVNNRLQVQIRSANPRIRGATRCRAVTTERQGALNLIAAIASTSLLLTCPYADAVPETTAAGTNLGFITNEEVDAKRAEFRMKRSYDGHVALQNKKTLQFWDVKNDAKYPGMVMLREPETGQVYVLAYANLKQVDLSDDDMVAAMSMDNWEESVEPVQSAPKSDKTVDKLQLTREGFYNVVSIVDP